MKIHFKCMLGITIKITELFYIITVLFHGITGLSMLKFYSVPLERRGLFRGNLEEVEEWRKHPQKKLCAADALLYFTVLGKSTPPSTLPSSNIRA